MGDGLGVAGLIATNDDESGRIDVVKGTNSGVSRYLRALTYLGEVGASTAGPRLPIGMDQLMITPNWEIDHWHLPQVHLLNPLHYIPRYA